MVVNICMQCFPGLQPADVGDTRCPRMCPSGQTRMDNCNRKKDFLGVPVSVYLYLVLSLNMVLSYVHVTCTPPPGDRKLEKCPSGRDLNDVSRCSSLRPPNALNIAPEPESNSKENPSKLSPGQLVPQQGRRREAEASATERRHGSCSEGPSSSKEGEGGRAGGQEEGEGGPGENQGGPEKEV